ncbi:carbohydrate ABC transporter permease [Oscillospiraceae bacterium HV4-5-C5C]|nr:carbohydrate ABC transporter permease [Oscillospiraceae bacterium HV4-5-C5C]
MKTNRQKIKASGSDRAFDLINILILTLLLLLVAYPLYFVVIASISDPKLVATGRVLFLPKSFNLEGYKKVIQYSPIWVGYRNTILYTLGYTFVSVMVSMLTGFALGQRKLPGVNLFTGLFIFTMFFNGGLIPTYLLMKDIGLYGNPLIIILMGAVSVNNIIIARTFIKSTIPGELFEAASIDGCSYTGYFFKIVLPLSKALLAVLVLFAAVGQWNSWYNAMIYLKDDNQMPLQMVLRDLIVIQSAMSSSTEAATVGGDAAAQVYLVESMRYAIIIVSTLPIMCIYPFLQKYFAKGIMIGSVKG